MADDDRLLLFVPTYNERENAPNMARLLASLGLDADLLFIDDASPDGTGELLDAVAANEIPRLHVVHRPGKLGIGSAHQAGIAWAYDHGYATLVTLDCDFTHSPADVPRLLARAATCDLAVGSRHLAAGSLPGWNPLRRALTAVGHVLTRRVLGVRYDATGAFRAYRLDRIPRAAFGLVRSGGYAFFFESLFVLDRTGVRIGEIPIVLPSRTYGHSKMTAAEAGRSGRRVLAMAVAARLHPDRFRLPPADPPTEPALTDPQDWDTYWRSAGGRAGLVHRAYAVAAWVYRNGINRPELNRYVRRHFPPDSRLLHAGCGSGQVDADLQREMRLTALDISPAAVARYRRTAPSAEAVRHADLFALAVPPGVVRRRLQHGRGRALHPRPDRRHSPPVPPRAGARREGRPVLAPRPGDQRPLPAVRPPVVRPGRQAVAPAGDLAAGVTRTGPVGVGRGGVRPCGIRRADAGPGAGGRRRAAAG